MRKFLGNHILTKLKEINIALFFEKFIRNFSSFWQSLASWSYLFSFWENNCAHECARYFSKSFCQRFYLHFTGFIFSRYKGDNTSVTRYTEILKENVWNINNPSKRVELVHSLYCIDKSFYYICWSRNIINYPCSEELARSKGK